MFSSTLPLLKNELAFLNSSYYLKLNIKDQAHVELTIFKNDDWVNIVENIETNVEIYILRDPNIVPTIKTIIQKIYSDIFFQVYPYFEFKKNNFVILRVKNENNKIKQTDKIFSIDVYTFLKNCQGQHVLSNDN